MALMTVLGGTPPASVVINDEQCGQQLSGEHRQRHGNASKKASSAQPFR
jgi:hypothetical protein